MFNKKLRVLDLFCGCGGMSFGFEQAGYEIVAGLDIWADALQTFAYNHPNAQAIEIDLFDSSPLSFSNRSQIKNIDIIIGGPPCQGFSLAGKRIVEDKRNKLYKSFVKFVNFFQPKAFVLENVPNILSMANGKIKKQIIKDFEELGYNVVSQVLLAADFGVPQNRKRAFFIGIKNQKLFEFPTPKGEIITTWDAISDLPEDTLIDGSPYPSKAKSDFQKLMRHLSDGVHQHQVTNHTLQTSQIIALVPDGGNYKNLPKELQNTRKVNIAWTRLNSMKPSITIDTGHNHHFHYKYNRVPTARESARLQSFPDNFLFQKGKTSQLKQIGNAVPPLLAKAIAERLLKYV